MREILFRGKIVDNILVKPNNLKNDWIYGYLVADNADCSLKKIGKCIGSHDGSYCEIYTWEDCLHEYNPYQVIPETVGQFTGLYDKNNQKIFDGDILELDEDLEIKQFYDLLIVKITNIGVQYSTKKEQNWLWCLDDAHYFSYYKIIGNVFDNPELLK